MKLRISQAIHHGEVLGFHLGSATRRHYVVAGRAVATVARLLASVPQGGLGLSRTARARLEPGRSVRPTRARRGPSDETALVAYLEPAIRPLLRGFRGELRRAAVLFLETAGARSDALQTFYSALAAALDVTDGLLLKTDISAHGTRWLCVFGIPKAHEDDPDRAAAAALDVMAAAPRGLRVRGGLHDGTLANVTVGTSRRRSFDIVGDVVNTAARALEQAAWGEVFVTEGTRASLDAATTVPRGVHRVKGKATPLVLHALAARAAAARILPERARMVGRRTELESLAGALEDARAGRGAAVLVRGEAGVGKSRLKLEAARIARTMGFDVHEGRAASFGGAPYQAVRGLLGSTLGLKEQAGAREILRTVENAGSHLGLDAGDRAHLADILGARPSGSRIGDLDPRALRLNDMIAIRAVIQALAREMPRLLVLEDMHWSDGATAEAAAWIARASRESPLVLLLVCRPGYQAPPGVVEIVLEELDDGDVRDLIAAHLGTVPPAIEALVRSRAGGNPFYVEEVVRHLLESGLLALSDQGYELTRELRPDDLPPTVESVIASRLDRLAGAVRKTVQHAAVIGRTFSAELLRRLPGAARREAPHLAELCRRRVVFPIATEPGHFIFKHALTRDVAYASILVESRRKLHAAVADAMDAAPSAERSALLAALGHHREHAGQTAEARACYLAAARQSCGRYAHDDAEKLYRAYLALAPELTLEATRTRLDLARNVLLSQGRTEAAEGELRRCIAEARELDDAPLESEALTALGDLLRMTGRTSDAHARFAEARDILDESGKNPSAEARVLANVASLLREQGRLEEAEARFEEALAILEVHGDAAEQGLVLGNMALLLAERGKTAAAEAAYERALASHRAAGNRRFEGIVLGNLGLLHSEQGREDARELLERALVIHRGMRDRRSEGIVLGNLANHLYEQGAVQDARDLFTESLAIYREVGDRRFECIALCNLATISAQAGNAAQARADYERALEVLHAVGDRRIEGQVLACLGDLHFEQGHAREGTEHYEKAAAIQSEVGNRRVEGVTAANFALWLHLAGEPARARRVAARAEKILRVAGERVELGKLACTRAHLALDEGRAATRYLRRARELARESGARPGSQLAIAIGTVQRAVADVRRGVPLSRGRRREDLSAGQAACLDASMFVDPGP